MDIKKILELAKEIDEKRDKEIVSKNLEILVDEIDMGTITDKEWDICLNHIFHLDSGRWFAMDIVHAFYHQIMSKKIDMDFDLPKEERIKNQHYRNILKLWDYFPNIKGYWKNYNR
jgi:hypothetical protein